MDQKTQKMDTPAEYAIQVSGVLDEHWAGNMSGMTITLEPARDQKRPLTTILRGSLPDQAALIGVLNALYDYHYPILSVECWRLLEQ